jgi:hypothetical protein
MPWKTKQWLRRAHQTQRGMVGQLATWYGRFDTRVSADCHRAHRDLVCEHHCVLRAQTSCTVDQVPASSSPASAWSSNQRTTRPLCSANHSVADSQEGQRVMRIDAE